MIGGECNRQGESRHSGPFWYGSGSFGPLVSVMSGVILLRCLVRHDMKSNASSFHGEHQWPLGAQPTVTYGNPAPPTVASYLL